MATSKSMTRPEFDRLLETSSSKPRSAMRDALRLILVDGATWRSAANRSGVSESGILRAMRRLGVK